MSETLSMKVRLKIEKTGRSAYISHLDLMKTLCASFRRAGLELKHSEGFNQRPYISLARPLSLGFESRGELCDIALTKEEDITRLPEMINPYLPEGLKVLSAKTEFVPAKDIFYSVCEITAHFNKGVPEGLAASLEALFSGSLTVEKRTKSGVKMTEISGMIKSIGIRTAENAVVLDAVLKDAPDGSLNPAYLISAAGEKIEAFTPDDVSYMRKGFLDLNGNAAE